jgi:hypothetical protein
MRISENRPKADPISTLEIGAKNTLFFGWAVRAKFQQLVKNLT